MYSNSSSNFFNTTATFVSTYLVIGGHDWIYFDPTEDNDQRTDEIVQLDASDDRVRPCLPIADLPYSTMGAIGVFVQGRPLVCGRNWCASYDIDASRWVLEKDISVST